MVILTWNYYIQRLQVEALKKLDVKIVQSLRKITPNLPLPRIIYSVNGPLGLFKLMKATDGFATGAKIAFFFYCDKEFHSPMVKQMSLFLQYFIRIQVLDNEEVQYFRDL